MIGLRVCVCVAASGEGKGGEATYCVGSQTGHLHLRTSALQHPSWSHHRQHSDAQEGHTVGAGKAKAGGGAVGGGGRWGWGGGGKGLRHPPLKWKLVTIVKVRCVSPTPQTGSLTPRPLTAPQTSNTNEAPVPHLYSQEVPGP
jgi:hypothetical protein